MKRIIRCWTAGLVTLAITALAALPALAVPDAPRVVGTAAQASGTQPWVYVTTTAPISGGDAIVVIASGEANMRPWAVGNCTFCVSSGGQAGASPEPFGLDGSVGQTSVRTYVAWASQAVAAGAQLRVDFGGTAGGKAVTVLAISGAESLKALANGTPNGATPQAQGIGTAIGWSCSVSCGIPANLMMLSANVVSGGGSDTYSEDAGWTFLHQTASGAWPAIRIAYKPSGAGGSFSYGLTNATSRSWISGAVLVK